MREELIDRWRLTGHKESGGDMKAPHNATEPVILRARLNGALNRARVRRRRPAASPGHRSRCRSPLPQPPKRFSQRLFE